MRLPTETPRVGVKEGQYVSGVNLSLRPLIQKEEEPRGHSVVGYNDFGCKGLWVTYLSSFLIAT